MFYNYYYYYYYYYYLKLIRNQNKTKFVDAGKFYIIYMDMILVSIVLWTPSCFISWGKVFQIFGARDFILSLPRKTLCTFWIWKFICFLNLSNFYFLSAPLKLIVFSQSGILKVNRDRTISFEKFSKVYYKFFFIISYYY